jgi:cation:H+ antiporter
MLAALLAGTAGVVLLAYASDQFVIGAARAATLLRLSPIVIGAVVIGFGTSAPELLVSALAAGQGTLDVAVGNVVGSNIANLSLVLGAAALFTPIAVSAACCAARHRCPSRPWCCSRCSCRAGSACWRARS